MFCEVFKAFFENYGDLLCMVGGSIISIIVSIIQWLIFFIKLFGVRELFSNNYFDLMTRNNNQYFMGNLNNVDFDETKCYSFSDKTNASEALDDIQGSKFLLIFSMLIASLWIGF